MSELIAKGPAAYRDGLFAAPRAAALRALRAHANTISHARYKALEDSFPLTRQAMGGEAFHALAERYLRNDAPRARPLRLIGADFAERIDDPAIADLADAEWAMLEAYGAAEAPAIEMQSIAGQSPEQLVAARVALHPAARLVALRRPEVFAWEGMPATGEPWLLVTRPASEQRVAQVSDAVARAVRAARNGCVMGELFELDAPAVTLLVQTGALRPLVEGV
ncbi:HvfC/BufC family peptide modification chaperone [Sphingomicrobium lutaoense]|uniref:Putative DNA-binding domain-containing protein n=1 Tax=Sphingomicrobium lutaoense TaxID=515949 RepID=A0A839Z1X8_9SPHN|nr:hypothetical protein [Sphingomicrobium lutaoense]